MRLDKKAGQEAARDGQARAPAALGGGNYSILRKYEERPDAEQVLKIPCDDAFSVIVQLRDFASHRLWRGGSLVYDGGHARQSMSIAYLGDEVRCQHRAAYDNLRFTLPCTAMNELFYEEGVPRPVAFDRITGQVDPVAYHLAQALLPALGMPGQVNQLFIDQVMLALCTHLNARYGEAPAPRESARGLAGWQLRRAQELIANHLSDGLSVARLAQECALSRSHFTRAFKLSTGLSPHDWLLRRRVEKAKELMRDTSLCLSQIGLDCGFADQSHFSRVFLRLAGMSPANWRRFQRLER
ncbi:AraC family transcriptional regulator [Pseudomonas sp. RW407]|uniref:AraC family transcriptional regulator n=1 Tax=Pseudomonas sp. RW407 TaxID=2202894 RepID=UPI000D6EF6C0|nr:AraC family transcriptional regulator [Pseudomonas sp. RW407]PWU25733.1 AraC family transcriptional regulator [Pseudomonas sp. RW407]